MTPEYMYVKIADRLRDDIASGRYRVGDFLPSRAEICAEFGVAVITARAGLQILADEGLITIGRGRRSVVTGRPLTRGTTSVARVSGEDLVTELYQLGRSVQKLEEMADRDGFLHPSTLHELHHSYLRVVVIADRVWQQK